MGEKLYRISGNSIFYLTMGIFAVFTIFLVFMGSFYWMGDNTAYNETGVLLRGLQMLFAVLLLFLVFRIIIKILDKADKKKLFMISAGCMVLMLILQFCFVAAAQTGIRYDSLKVYDEAVALFSQPGIGMEDLEGYFARYSNNYAVTIMTHWIIKVFHAIGIIHADFSNAVLVLQFVNVLFVDVAFAGVWAMLQKYVGTKQATVFLAYMALNPLSYVWMPFYYTNTCSMMFAVWGTYLLFLAVGQEKGRRGSIKLLILSASSGVLYSVGFQLRATVAIALIAAILVLFVFFKDFIAKGINGCKSVWAVIGIMLLAFIATSFVYGKVEDRYLTFDEKDTEFPMTHWVAMGLSDTGTFSPADEAYTMSFLTAEEKKAATVSLIKERVSDLGIMGVAKLYGKKLAITFADGTGGYHSELNISGHYDTLWQIVYGVYRDPLLSVTQIFYLLSLLSGLVVCGGLLKKKLPSVMFFFPLLLVGSYLFQMIWEAGTIYSIGTMYVNGVMVSLGLCQICDYEAAPETKEHFWYLYKNIILGAMLGLGLIGVSLIVRGFLVTKYVQVTMSVDQFLFQANGYISLSDGKEITQGFKTDKEFSTIAFEVSNPDGEFNDSTYQISLYDSAGNLLQQQVLRGYQTTDYTFYAMGFENVPGITDYEIRIRKMNGKNDLIFLYYDTGHYDVYPDGKMTGLTQGDKADLAFRVYWREEE